MRNVRAGMHPTAVLCAALLTAASVHGQSRWVVGGGILVNNGAITADELDIAPGASLAGTGFVDGDLLVSGTVNPGGPTAGVVGTQAVSGAVTFSGGSTYLCDAAAHEQLDRISAGGAVTGAGTVSMNGAAGAYPISRTIIQGAPASDYGGLTLDDAYTWRLETSGALNLDVTHLRGDTDADSLPDWWEDRHFGSRTAGDPAAYSDADEHTDGDEYAANTDPNDPGSVLRVTSITVEPPTNVVLRWSTADGRRYTVLRRPGGPAAGVATAGVVTAYAMPETVWTNADESAGRSFYEIAVRENLP